MILVSPSLLPIPVVTFFAISILSSFTLNFSHFLLVCTIVFPFKSQSAPHYQHFCTPNLVYPALQHCKTLILFLCPASIYSSVAVCFPECFSQLLSTSCFCNPILHTLTRNLLPPPPCHSVHLYPFPVCCMFVHSRLPGLCYPLTLESCTQSC